MINETERTLLRRAVRQLPRAPLFVTVSGAHLYGFPSPDSDFDLRGAFVLPLASVIGLDQPQETLTRTFEQDGREMDLVVHDIKKFLTLLLNKNGYALEQLYSPLVVQGGVALEELRALGRGCITRHVYHHYQGFARNQIKRFEAQSPGKVKTLLYIYRVLLTGIWLLETGQVQANLLQLNESFGLPFIPDLIAQKRREDAALAEVDPETHRSAMRQLLERLEGAFQTSSLPEAPTNRPALNDFLVRLRMERRDG
jgi:predicted nucleotidyltransferase